MSQLLQQAYNSSKFREQGHQLIDLLADYLENVQNNKQMIPATRWTSPEKSYNFWKDDPINQDNENWIELFDKILDNSVHVHHPQYMGHQISPTVPIAALAGFLSDFLNNGMGVYEMGVASTTLEKMVIEMVAKQMNLGPEAGGLLTSGGTLGNLTALLCARSVKAKVPIWKDGGGQNLALMVSEQAHYCVDRAVRIMGWGADGIIKIPCNSQFQMRTELLEEYYEKAKQSGRQIIAVVGSACSTSTGSFDDLEAIGDFCKKHDLWFHIDGAHGGAAVFSRKYDYLIKGLKEADSVIMDFHKMLLTPSITTALVFKKENHSFQTFAQKAQYLWNEEEDREWYNMAKRTFECTKLMMSIKVFATYKYYGVQLWEDYVTKMFDLGLLLGELIQTSSNFELATVPECNIVCFRYKPEDDFSLPQINDLNEFIRQSILEDGSFYIVKTNLDGHLWLRCTFTNPFTEKKDLLEMLKTVENIGEAYLERVLGY